MTQNCFYFCKVVYLTISKGRSLSDIEIVEQKLNLAVIVIVKQVKRETFLVILFFQ